MDSTLVPVHFNPWLWCTGLPLSSLFMQHTFVINRQIGLPSMFYCLESNQFVSRSVGVSGNFPVWVALVPFWQKGYDMGDRELLVVKLALEEWHHWLEGALHHFIIWADHKNLTNLKCAKRLNSCQAQWSLFFACFNFFPLLPSRLQEHQAESTLPSVILWLQTAGILPSTCRVVSLSWEIKETIHQALQNERDPDTGQPDWRFVPSASWSVIIHWAHTTRFACHSNMSRTTTSFRCHFWWDSLDRDVRHYVATCSMCACGKTSSQHPSGLLQPLATKNRPCSHIALDFATIERTDGKVKSGARVSSLLYSILESCHLVQQAIMDRICS